MVAGAAASVFAPALVALLVPGGPAVIAEGARFLRITSPACGFIAPQLTIALAFRAAEGTQVTMMLALASHRILLFPLAFVLSRRQVLWVPRDRPADRAVAYASFA